MQVVDNYVDPAELDFYFLGGLFCYKVETTYPQTDENASKLVWTRKRRQTVHPSLTSQLQLRPAVVTVVVFTHFLCAVRDYSHIFGVLTLSLTFK